MNKQEIDAILARSTEVAIFPKTANEVLAREQVPDSIWTVLTEAIADRAALLVEVERLTKEIDNRTRGAGGTGVNAPPAGGGGFGRYTT